MHALAYIWGLTPEPSLSSAVICSSSPRTICHYSFALFCSCVVELLLSYHRVDLKKKKTSPHTQTGLYYQCSESVGVCKLDFRLGSFLILAADAVCLRALKCSAGKRLKATLFMCIWSVNYDMETATKRCQDCHSACITRTPEILLKSSLLPLLSSKDDVSLVYASIMFLTLTQFFFLPPLSLPLLL